MRIQAFEFMDLPQTPRVLRDSVVESLGNAMRWSGVCKTAAPVFGEFFNRLENDTVLDLCSGSGEPAAAMLEALKDSGGKLPRFMVSDLFPVVHHMAQAASKHPDHIEVISSPLDATDVPAVYAHGGRMVVSAFHHFPPALARRILEDSAKKGKPIFIMEPMTRKGRGALHMGVYFVAANFLNPFLSKQDRLLKALFTYLIPLIPLMATWDGLVSIVRMYTREDFEALVEGIDTDFHWEFRQVTSGLDSTVSIYMGWPRTVSQD
ncbi:MAG: hypothetical protein P1U64_08230 [Alcanivoracaceae bacterium]|nr:hypothetical protein [Alcanivoracaceae bacterium]